MTANTNAGMMAERGMRLAWIAIALVALMLLIATIFTGLRARAVAQVGAPGQVSGLTAVYLRQEPSASGSILTTLARGDAVKVVGTFEKSGRWWYQVRVEDYQGWLPATQVRLLEQ